MAIVQNTTKHETRLAIEMDIFNRFLLSGLYFLFHTSIYCLMDIYCTRLQRIYIVQHASADTPPHRFCTYPTTHTTRSAH